MSEFYLRGFTAGRRKRSLYEYRKGEGSVCEVSPEEASAEPDAFAIDDPVDPYVVEKGFSRIESRASRAIRRIRGRQPLSTEQRRAVSEFAALCLVRSSRRAEEALELSASNTLENAVEYLRSPGMRMAAMLANPDLHYDDCDAWAQAYIDEVRAGTMRLPHVSEKQYLKLVPGAVNGGAPLLFGMSWTFEEAPNGDFFVAGDEPAVTRHVSAPLDSGYVAVNDRRPGVEVTLPINRSLCLVARWDEPQLDDVYVKVSSERVREVNLRSVFAAHRAFFSPAVAPACDELVKAVGLRGLKVGVPMNLLAIRRIREQKGE